MPDENSNATNPPNPYDTTAESAELEALQNELAQAQESLEGNAAKEIATLITPEMEDLFFEDREAFLKALFGLQNDYLAKNINPKIERINSLSKDITTKQEFGAIDKAREEFLNAHPEVDFAELMQFYSTLSEDVQMQLASGTPLEFFENLLALKEKGNAEENADKDNLPTQLKGVEANASRNAIDSDLPMNRF